MNVYDDKNHSIYNGKKLRVEIFGASHSEKIGVYVDGLDGENADFDLLQKFLERRRAKPTFYSTKRLESDKVIVESGYNKGFSGRFKAVIENKEQKSGDYLNTVKKPRPSHADFVAYEKYGDKFDYRGGGKFSGRMTAPMCIAGGICKQILQEKGIKINAYISQIGSVKGKSYKDLKADINDLTFNDEFFPLLDESVKVDMENEIELARESLDSVGGIIECVITGVPVGTGEYMFDSIESVISSLAFAVPAVKGIEFGLGFNFACVKGSVANDAFYYDGEKVKTKTNNNGGINGGLANGMPITFRVVIKPTPSIAIEQDTVDLINKQNTKIKIEGRHDACIVPRAVPVIEAISAIAIYDCL